MRSRMEKDEGRIFVVLGIFSLGIILMHTISTQPFELVYRKIPIGMQFMFITSLVLWTVAGLVKRLNKEQRTRIELSAMVILSNTAGIGLVYYVLLNHLSVVKMIITTVGVALVGSMLAWSTIEHIKKHSDIRRVPHNKGIMMFALQLIAVIGGTAMIIYM